MRKSYKLLGFVLCMTALGANAQNESDSIKVTYKNKSVTVLPQGDESTTTIRFKDTSINKKIVVRISVSDAYDKIEKGLQNQLDSNSRKVYDFIKIRKYSKERKHFIETSYLPTFDLGFASTYNEVENARAYTPKMLKSVNLNLGLIRQNMNLISGQLLLSYGLNLNNYYLKYSDKQTLRYLDAQGLLNDFRDTVNIYNKNRFDVRYLSVPVLLEYHTQNNDFNIAAGIEFGFNGRSKEKLKGENKGLSFDHENERDVKINPTQMQAVLRIGINNVAIFGKYSLTDMYKSTAYVNGQNPHQHLYSFGICLFGI